MVSKTLLCLGIFRFDSLNRDVEAPTIYPYFTTARDRLQSGLPVAFLFLARLTKLHHILRRAEVVFVT
jgi:hypothetical protein